MGSKAKDKLNRQATSKEGEVGRLQQRGQSVPAASLVSTPSPPLATAGRALVALRRRKTLLAINQTVLAKTQPAINFWGSSHKYIT